MFTMLPLVPAGDNRHIPVKRTQPSVHPYFA